jgi:hypothetical protein
MHSDSLRLYKAVDRALATMERAIPRDRLRALLARFDSPDAEHDVRVLAAHEALALALREVRERIDNKVPDPCTLRRDQPAEFGALVAAMTAWPNSSAPERLQAAVHKSAALVARSRSPAMLRVAAQVLAKANFLTVQQVNRLRIRHGRADKAKQAAAATGSAISRRRRVESRSSRSDD